MRQLLYTLAVASAVAGLGQVRGGASQQSVPADFLITLERTACHGECPVYRVSIDARGNVTFEGINFVRASGRHTSTIPVSSVAALFGSANRIGFFTLLDSYSARVTDLPMTIVTIRANGSTKRVEDYLGAPKALKEFEHEIDESAGTRRWIRIDVPTLQQLVREGGLNSPAEKADALQRAVSSNDVDVVHALLAESVDPNATFFETGTTPLGAAACAGNLAVVRVLLDAGADPAASGHADLPPLECARTRRDLAARAARGPQPPDLGVRLLFVVEYDGVIAALEKALK